MKSRISKFAILKGTKLEGANAVAKFVKIIDSDVGYGSYVASYSKLFKCKIGRYCSIGQKTQVIFGNHPTSKYVSTHPAFYSKSTQTGFSYVDEDKFEEYSFADEDKKWFVAIGNDVWIGYDVKILSGVHIGDGSIIAAGSVVTRDVQAYSIVGGVPAKNIRMRFSQEDIQFLLQLKWWDKDLNWIKQYAEYFEDINVLKERITHE